MKKLANLFIFLLISKFCFSQDSIQDIHNFKYKIGIKISVDRSGVAKFTDQSKFGEHINFGIPVFRKISKYFQFETGVYYLQKNTDVSLPDNQALTINYSFAHIRLPLMIRLETKYFYTSLGLYGDYFIDFSSESDYYDDKFYYEINKLNMGLNMNFGIESKLSNHFNLFMETGISNDLTAFVKNGEYFKFVNYGFSIGSTFKF